MPGAPLQSPLVERKIPGQLCARRIIMGHAHLNTDAKATRTPVARLNVKIPLKCENAAKCEKQYAKICENSAKCEKKVR